MHRNVDASSWESCTLAPPATSDSGTPRPSTRRLRLRPFFPPVGGVRPCTLLRQRSFARGPVYALPFPGDALHLVVFGQSRLPETKKKARLLPALKMRMHCAGAAKFPRQRLPLAARAQHVNDGREDPPGRHGLSPRSRPALIDSIPPPTDPRDKRLYLRPKRIGNRPRLDLCHAVRHLRPTRIALHYAFIEGYQVEHYLRISSKANSKEIHWPNGATDRLTKVNAGEVITVKDGPGIVHATAALKAIVSC
jgi:hypothetical protein